jgi:hypothetical protein
MGSVSSTFSEKVRLGSYRPPSGLAAAMTEQRACRGGAGAEGLRGTQAHGVGRELMIAHATRHTQHATQIAGRKAQRAKHSVQSTASKAQRAKHSEQSAASKAQRAKHGLAAAVPQQRACSCVTMPALEMEMDCCSMACMGVCVCGVCGGGGVGCVCVGGGGGG